MTVARLRLPKRFALRRSPALVAALSFALGGVGAAVGNIALARMLSAEEYAAVALLLALTQLGITLGPLGWPTLIIRYGFVASAGLLVRSVLGAALVSVAIAGAAAAIYRLRTELVTLLAVTVVLAATNRVAATFFQARQAFSASLLLTQVHNWVLLTSALLLIVMGSRSAASVATVLAVGYAITTLIGWRVGWGNRQAGSKPVFTSALMREGLTIVMGALALSIMFQLDRLLIPRVLSLQDLATYSVAAAVVGSPFRMLQTGAGFALLPRIRACGDAAGARKLIRHEGTLMAAVSAACALAVVIAMPLIAAHVLGRRYNISAALIAAIIMAGFTRVWDGLATAAATALGSPRELTYLTTSGWLAVVCAVGCAVAARGAGLVGIVYGLAAGWLLHAAGASVLAAKAIRRLDTSSEVPNAAAHAAEAASIGPTAH
ncbi:MAG TPA: oligosaccharide flippase family protein [Steroidobacteraceae bacterium]|nr:oligosaccharide flippase family protein [Steroidobacteraceae bacterium]